MAKKEQGNEKEFTVKRQKEPIFKVVSAGVCVEFTDRYPHAKTAYESCRKPKTMFRLEAGSAFKMFEEYL